MICYNTTMYDLEAWLKRLPFSANHVATVAKPSTSRKIPRTEASKKKPEMCASAHARATPYVAQGGTLGDGKEKKPPKTPSTYEKQHTVSLPAVNSVCETIRDERREKCKTAVDTPAPHHFLPREELKLTTDTDGPGKTQHGNIERVSSKETLLLPAPHYMYCGSSSTGKRGASMTTRRRQDVRHNNAQRHQYCVAQQLQATTWRSPSPERMIPGILVDPPRSGSCCPAEGKTGARG